MPGHSLSDYVRNNDVTCLSEGAVRKIT